MFIVGGEQGAGGDGLVEGDETAVVMHSKGEQVEVGQLGWPVNVVVAECVWIGNAEIVRPKCMVRRGGGFVQAFGRLRYGDGSYVTGLGDDANKSILGERTGRPSKMDVLLQPGIRLLVMLMDRIKQRDQDVDVEQRPHQTPSSSRNRSIISLVTILPGTSGKGLNP